MGKATLAGQQVQIDELSSENKAYADKVAQLEAELASLKEESEAPQAATPDKLTKLEWRKRNANVTQVVLVDYVQQVTTKSGNIVDGCFKMPVNVSVKVRQPSGEFLPKPITDPAKRVWMNVFDEKDASNPVGSQLFAEWQKDGALYLRVYGDYQDKLDNVISVEKTNEKTGKTYMEKSFKYIVPLKVFAYDVIKVISRKEVVEQNDLGV